MCHVVGGEGVTVQRYLYMYQIAGGHTCENSSLIAYDAILLITYPHFRGTRGGAIGYKPEDRGCDS